MGAAGREEPEGSSSLTPGRGAREVQARLEGRWLPTPTEAEGVSGAQKLQGLLHRCVQLWADRQALMGWRQAASSGVNFFPRS